jgi:Zn-dependent protease
MGNDVTAIAFGLVSYLLILWFSLSVHEYAHALLAKVRGDRTAELMGRLTLNPVSHIDPIGTVVMPVASFFNPTGFFLFGWAKPVPVDSRYLKNPRVDMFWIAFAGPLSNVILALLGTLALAIFLIFAKGSLFPCLMGGLNDPGCDRSMHDVLGLFRMFIYLNVSLFLLNMIPVHPLDGGKVIARFLPRKTADWLEEAEFYLAIGLMLAAIAGVISLILKGPVNLIGGALLDVALRLSQAF